MTPESTTFPNQDGSRFWMPNPAVAFWSIREVVRCGPAWPSWRNAGTRSAPAPWRHPAQIMSGWRPALPMLFLSGAPLPFGPGGFTDDGPDRPDGIGGSVHHADCGRYRVAQPDGPGAAGPCGPRCRLGAGGAGGAPRPAADCSPGGLGADQLSGRRVETG